MMIQCVVVLLLPWLGQCSLQCPTDCADPLSNGSRVSGVFTIYPAVQVYCDMGCQDTKEEGGWTVFQRRVDGTVNFFRPWNHYKDGFGNASSEYWLGLESLHHLTYNRAYELRVDMEDFEGGTAFARYSSFSVGSEIEGYKLTVGGFTNGGAGDSLTYHNGQKFSTFDKDQDNHPGNCAKMFLGAYWYNKCHWSNPNGLYLWGPTSHNGVGMNWFAFKGFYYSLKSITMKIRPVG